MRSFTFSPTSVSTSLKFGLSLLLFFGSVFLANGQEVENYVVEPNHSTIGFSVPIAGGLTRVSGKFTKFIITLDFKEGDISKSVFKARIKVESIDTGIERRDNHLKSETFFDLESHPEITFESNEIMAVTNGYQVKGHLTMHGITKPLEIPLVLKGKTDRYLAFEAKSSLMRDDFEVGKGYVHPGFPDFISNRIDFTFSFWMMGPIPEEMLEKVKTQIFGN